MFFYINPKLSILAALVGLSIIIRDFVINYRIFYNLRNLTEKIQIIAEKGDMMLSIKSYNEGDFSILSSEIYKILRKLKAVTEDLNKQRNVLSDFLADISHQIKTPLTSVDLMLTRLLSQNLDEQERKKLLYQIKIKTESLEWLILALLKLSKIENKVVNLETEKISLNEIINKVIYEDLSTISEFNQVDIIFENGKNFVITGDFKWLEEAFSNIIKDSIEHTPNYGKVYIKIYDSPLYTGVKIEDTGKGFDPENIKFIFDRFYKDEKADDKNFGIGLAIAKSVIERHNASVEAYNTEKGACFEVKFYKGIL